MKNLMPLMVLFLFFLGCAKEETTPTIDDNKQMKESSVYVYNTSTDTPAWELVDMDKASSIQNISDAATIRSNNGNSIHAHGHYHAPIQFTSVSFSATQNNGGTHGSAEVLITPSNFTLHILMDTHCLNGDGNDVYYTGLITEAIESPFPFDITGWYFEFGVRDNGEGENAPRDQYHSSFTLTNFPLCDHIPPGTFADVGEESDRIKVNN